MRSPFLGQVRDSSCDAQRARARLHTGIGTNGVLHGAAARPVALSQQGATGALLIKNEQSPDFAHWASRQGVQKLAGDFNGDGLTDIALVGGPGWDTIPIALSQGNGTFDIRNRWIGEFAAWAQSGAQAVVGDYNWDAQSDIALVGNANWNTLPVAFSNGDGSFNVTNQGVGEFQRWSSRGDVTRTAGRFIK
jgi:serralysin